MSEPTQPKRDTEPPANPIPETTRATASHPTRRYRALIFQSYVIAAVISFTLLAFLATSTAYFPLDLTITRSLQTFNPLWFDWLMRLVSLPGNGPQALIVMSLLVALIYLAGLHWEAGMSAATGACGYSLHLLVKFIIHRPRPAADLVRVFQNLTDYSFPSGHVMTYVAFYGFLWFLTYTLLRHSWKRTALLFLFGGMVLLVGASRIYLGQHWASDVLGAYLLGSLVLATAIQVYRWGKRRFFVRQPTAPEQPGPA
jgi:membrane-associated phospholipid phosphatase